MNRSILFFIVLLSSSCMVSPQISVMDDFEGNGSITTWFGDDCGINTSLSNPVKGGINNSNTVLEYRDTGGQYANVRFDVINNFDFSTGHTFSLKIYVPSSGLTGSQTNQISLKLQDGTLASPWVTQSEIIKTINLNQWQTVTFDFLNDSYVNLDGASPPPTQRSDFNRVVVQVNGENNNDQVLAYLDDIDYDGEIAEDPAFDTLVWSDEFDVDGPVDGSKWFHQTQLPNGNSWYNNEIQHYTDRTDNAIVEGGILKIIAKKESFTDQGVNKQYTSARLNSKYAFTYGRVEIRAKLPTGVGTWPALWTLGTNITETGAYWQTQGFGTTPWPNCGEIDIMEHWGTNQDFIQSAIHSPSSFGNTTNKGGQSVTGVSNEFHIYTLEWSEDKMVFSVDGVVHYTYNPATKNASTWPFDSDQYLLFNVAILPSIPSNFTSSNLEIDYVRIYKQSTLSNPNIAPAKDKLMYPNPVSDVLNLQLGQTNELATVLTLYTVEGKEVRSFKQEISNGQITLDKLGDLPAGVYLLNFKIDQKNQTIKFIKN